MEEEAHDGGAHGGVAGNDLHGGVADRLLGFGARRPVEVVLQCPGRRAHECSRGQRHEQQGLMTR